MAIAYYRTQYLFEALNNESVGICMGSLPCAQQEVNTDLILWYAAAMERARSERQTEFSTRNRMIIGSAVGLLAVHSKCLAYPRRTCPSITFHLPEALPHCRTW